MTQTGGRILCAMGYSGAQFDPEKVDLFFESAAGHMQIIKDGVAVDYSEEEATKILSEPEVTAIADIKMGDAQATAWGCDLTYDYVKNQRRLSFLTGSGTGTGKEHKRRKNHGKSECYLDKANVLIEALPYIQRFNRKIIVIKYGGSAMVDEELKRNVIQERSSSETGRLQTDHRTRRWKGNQPLGRKGRHGTPFYQRPARYRRAYHGDCGNGIK